MSVAKWNCSTFWEGPAKPRQTLYFIRRAVCSKGHMDVSAHSIPSLPHFRSFSASHESDFYTSGSLNSFYFGWVWKINGALGDYTKGYLVSLISRSSNSLLMLNPKLQSDYLATLKCWHQAPTGSAGGEGVPFMDSSVRPAASKGNNQIYFLLPVDRVVVTVYVHHDSTMSRVCI